MGTDHRAPCLPHRTRESAATQSRSRCCRCLLVFVLRVVVGASGGAGKNITIGRNASNPSTLNYFLQTHNGYVGDNDMDEAAVPAINPSRIQWPSDGMHTTNDIPLATIQGYLKAGRPVIAWVMDKQHFVLVIGWDAATPDTLYINDPGFDRATYSYSQDVVGWRLFDME